MSTNTKETAALHTNLKKFHENYDKISWSDGCKEERDCKDCEGEENNILCETCNSVGCNFKRRVPCS